MFKSKSCIAIASIAAGLISLVGVASALTVDQPVTPAFVKENAKRISVEAKKQVDGLIHFTITYNPPQPTYLVATTEIRSGDKILFQSTSTAFVREKSVTYYAAIAPERVAEAKFELFAGFFAESDGNPTPLPGGIAYQIQLSEFAKTAGEVK